MEHERGLKRMELESVGNRPSEADLGHNGGFDAARNIRLVPKFSEQEVENYFVSFEKVATSLQWPKEYWSLLLQSVLVGKAQRVYSSLSVERSSDYEVVKEAVLTAYELLPEAYRQKFQSLKWRL